MEKVLIANRGEIALRVVRACREAGLRSVVVYSSADAESAAVRAADEAIHIGPATPSRSYLHIPSIIGAALKTGADAVHPGYGFLSEDPDFAEICADHGLTFVGPRPEVMAALADKATARRLMERAGLPLLPGTTSGVRTVAEAHEVAAEIGYPLIVKAAAGGGGRGMAVVTDPRDLEASYTTTRAAAQKIFRDSTVYIERYLHAARHVEVQVLCDAHGAAIHLGERDCSVQRRHQKLIEEAPSVHVDPTLRHELGQAAVRGALAVGYTGVGTMEFLLDADGTFTFMEINTRIQVEHPVTEMVTGVDIVREQLRVASGERLALRQEDVALTGHAIECRINAEDPDRGFAPTPGRLTSYEAPHGPWTRVDSHCYPGWMISPHYDSLVAKVIVWGPTRPEALDRMDRALGEFDIAGPGVMTTIGFHRRALAHPAFRSGDYATDFVERDLAA